MGNVEISAMTIEDLELIKDVLSEDFDDFWNYNVFKAELLNPNSKYIVAKIDNNIVGFAGIWKAVDVIHITNIVTKKDLRNKGIGSILLDNLINLYKKYSFEEVGIRKKYYNNIDDALIMTKGI